MSIRLAIVALILTTALALGMIAMQVMRAPPPVAAPPAPLTVAYLVAARSLPAGTLARDEDFSVAAVPPERLPPGAMNDTPETRASLHGALVRHYLDAGAVVTADDVLRVRDRGFLAAVLEPGTRAAAVGVDEISGVAGLIWPGDRVDVILTQDRQGDTPIAQRVVSEPILEDARVIAVDQDITRGGVPAGPAAGHVARAITLQISADDVDRLTVAQHLGHLSLAVRPIGNGPPTALTRPSMFSKDVSSVLAESPAGTTMRVIHRDQQNDVTFR